MNSNLKDDNMKIPKIFLLLITISVLLLDCNNEPDPKSAPSITSGKTEYMSIDGLWKCTPETALQLETITLEPVIRISGKILNKLTVQGCFMWDGQFRDYWWLSKIQYNDSLNQITIHDQTIEKSTDHKEEHFITLYLEEQLRHINEILDYIKTGYN